MTVVQPTDSLAFLLRATTLIVKHDERDMTMRQMAILLFLASNADAAPGIKALAEQFGISRPSVSRSVDRLVKEYGYVQRTESIDDRRRVEIRIAPAGTRYLDGLALALRSLPAAKALPSS